MFLFIYGFLFFWLLFFFFFGFCFYSFFFCVECVSFFLCPCLFSAAFTIFLRFSLSFLFFFVCLFVFFFSIFLCYLSFLFLSVRGLCMLQPGVRLNLRRWETQIEDAGPPENFWAHGILISKSSPKDLPLSKRPGPTQRPGNSSSGHLTPNLQQNRNTGHMCYSVHCTIYNS